MIITKDKLLCRICQWEGAMTEADYAGTAPNGRLHFICVAHHELYQEAYIDVFTLSPELKRRYLDGAEQLRTLHKRYRGKGHA